MDFPWPESPYINKTLFDDLINYSNAYINGIIFFNLSDFLRTFGITNNLIELNFAKIFLYLIFMVVC
jgi:hypothetical protein